MEKNTFHAIDPEELPEECAFKVDKTDTWQAVLRKTEALSGIPAHEQMFWLFQRRDGGRTFRPVTAFLPGVRPSTP